MYVLNGEEVEGNSRVVGMYICLHVHLLALPIEGHLFFEAHVKSISRNHLFRTDDEQIYQVGREGTGGSEAAQEPR
jgi:hypothetical protein